MTVLSLWLVLRVDSTNYVMEAHIETINSSFCRTDGDRYICTDVPKTIPPKITNVEVTGYIGHELPEGSFFLIPRGNKYKDSICAANIYII